MAEERQAAREAHKVGLGLDELAGFVVDDGPLARALAGLGRLVQERESASRTEYRSKAF